MLRLSEKDIVALCRVCVTARWSIFYFGARNSKSLQMQEKIAQLRLREESQQFKMQTFVTWKETKAHISKYTNKGAYPGQGISNYNNGTTLLRSVDNTHYYDDVLENPDLVEYTLFGTSGNQNKDEPRYNYKFLNEERKIYLYRVKKENKETTWVWYGEYKLLPGIEELQHPGADGIMRRIYRVKLQRIG
jgi:hypothetical protein